jgi:hypothetical protein
MSFFLLVSGIAPTGRAENLPSAPLLVTILDDSGSLVHDAHVYIFSRNKKQFFGTREAHGATTFDLPVGDYRVYAGLTLETDGIIDHYASPEASIRVTAEDPASVILTLQKAQDSEMILSDTTRQKLGIDEKLAKYLN